MRNLSFPVSLAAIAVGALLTPACVTPHSVRFDHAAQVRQKAAAGCPESVTDRDGNRYATVLIGQRCWLAENLRVTRFRDGSAMPKKQMKVIDLKKYGRLYRWAAVSHRSGLCPQGWHVPSDAEFQQLEVAVGMAPVTATKTGWRGTTNESRKLKQFDVARRWTPAKRALVNKSGFSALAGGGSSGSFTGASGIYADFWTSTEHNKDRAWNRSFTWWSIHPSRHRIRRAHVAKSWWLSVRCILDTQSAPAPGAAPPRKKR